MIKKILKIIIVAKLKDRRSWNKDKPFVTNVIYCIFECVIKMNLTRWTASITKKKTKMKAAQGQF